MGTKVHETEPTEFLLKIAELNGVACATVKDGHVLIFTRSKLVDVLARIDANGNDKAIIFIKRPDFNG